MKKNTKRVCQHKREVLTLRLYVADTSPRSILAKTNLQAFCDHYLQEGYQLRVIDIIQEPDQAFENNVLATPTLVRTAPGPKRTVVGTFSDAAALVRAFDIVPPELKDAQSLALSQPLGHA